MKFSGYCHYVVDGNPVWGFDAYLRLRLPNVNGEEGRISTLNPRGKYYPPSRVYLFPNREAYDEFKRLLNEGKGIPLSWTVKVERYLEIPESAKVIVDTIDLEGRGYKYDGIGYKFVG